MWSLLFRGITLSVGFEEAKLHGVAGWILHEGDEMPKQLLKIYDPWLRKEAEKKDKCLEGTKIAVRSWVWQHTSQSGLKKKKVENGNILLESHFWSFLPSSCVPSWLKQKSIKTKIQGSETWIFASFVLSFLGFLCITGCPIGSAVNEPVA